LSRFIPESQSTRCMNFYKSNPILQWSNNPRRG
jgi:hypothetical protein